MLVADPVVTDAVLTAADHLAPDTQDHLIAVPYNGDRAGNPRTWPLFAATDTVSPVADWAPVTGETVFLILVCAPARAARALPEVSALLNALHTNGIRCRGGVWVPYLHGAPVWADLLNTGARAGLVPPSAVRARVTEREGPTNGADHRARRRQRLERPVGTAAMDAALDQSDRRGPSLGHSTVRSRPALSARKVTAR